MTATPSGCPRCYDAAKGRSTGVVYGGPCFLCGGTTRYEPSRYHVTAEAKRAGARRAAAINILNADLKTRDRRTARITGTARIHLEEHAPARHERMIETLLIAPERIGQVIRHLVQYAAENDI